MYPHRFAITKAAWSLRLASPVPSAALLWMARCALKATGMTLSSLRPALRTRAPVWRSITAFGMSSRAPDSRRQAPTCAEPLWSPLSYAPSGLETHAGPVLVAGTAPAAMSCGRFRTTTCCPRRRVSSSHVGRYAASGGTCSAQKRSVRSVTQVSADARAHMHPQAHVRCGSVHAPRSRATKVTGDMVSPSCSAQDGAMCLQGYFARPAHRPTT
jgi:hypothetical protein